MDFSNTNTQLWNFVIQFGIISICMLLSHFLRAKISFFNRGMIPTAVIAGFFLLALKSFGIVAIDTNMLETITFHGIALGFIAMTLQISEKGSTNASNATIGAKSGALIVSTYLVQGIVGLIITILLFVTIMPEIMPAAGILLPMGFGQGPGQANNVGGTYEGLGFVGGRSFGLSIAAAGYLVACIVGVIYVNLLSKRKKMKQVSVLKPISGDTPPSASSDDDTDATVAESIDHLSMQVALILFVYLLTYLAAFGLTKLLAVISVGLANTVSSILWGFNFIIGCLVAMLIKMIMKKFRMKKIIERQYQNNYLLSRLSGLAFDFMIVAGIGSIDIKNLSGLWLPFILLTTVGTVIILWFLTLMCKKMYKDYQDEAYLSMFGMLTGTISSGILLLREVDPEFKTPAANNLVVGSSFAIAFGAPMLLLIGLASKSFEMTLVTFGLLVIYLAFLLLFIFKFKYKQKNKNSEISDEYNKKQ